MADIASNYTPRIFIEYVADGVPHNATIRFARGVTLDDTTALDYLGRWVAFWNEVGLASGMQSTDRKAGITTTGAQYANEDSNIFYPISSSSALVISTLDDSGGGVTPIDRTLLYSVTGRSSGGKPIVLYMWGFRRTNPGASSPYSDWRLDNAEVPAVMTAIGNKLQPTSVGELGEVLAGTDGELVGFMRARMNVRVSSRAIDRARSGV